VTVWVNPMNRASAVSCIDVVPGDTDGRCRLVAGGRGGERAA